MNGTFPKEGRSNILKILAGAGGVNLECRLYKAGTTVNDNVTLSLLQEANYSGYAMQQLSGWSDPAATGSGDEQMFGPLFLFTHNGGGVANDIAGYFFTVTITAVVKLLWFTPLDAVKTMAGGTDQIPLRPVVGLRGLSA